MNANRNITAEIQPMKLKTCIASPSHCFPLKDLSSIQNPLNALNDEESFDSKTDSQSVAIEEVMNNVREEFDRDESDLPGEIKHSICNIINHSNWQEFAKITGHELLIDSFLELRDENLSGILLSMWQFNNKDHWPDLLDKFQQIGRDDAADILRDWVCENLERTSFEGCSNQSSETNVVTICTLK